MSDYKDDEKWFENWKNAETPWAGDDADKMFFELFKENIKETNGRKAFVPLCGNSGAVRWLYDKGYSLTALDLVPEAIQALKNLRFPNESFSTREETSGQTIEQCKRLKLVTANVLDFKSEDKFDLIYDRAALVALQPENYQRYHDVLLNSLTANGCIFTETVEYDQSKKEPPPFSISDECFHQIYSDTKINLLKEHAVGNIPDRYLELGIDKIIKRAYLVSL